MIHEAFKGFEVRFYLAVIVEGEPGVLVVFPVCLDPCKSAVHNTADAIFLRNSNCYLAGKFWKKFGGVLGVVCTTQSRDMRADDSNFPELTARFHKTRSLDLKDRGT